MTRNRIFLSFFSKVFPLFLLASVISLQYYFDKEIIQRPLIPPTVIPAKAIKIADLGLHSATSALMWLYAIQELGISSRNLPDMISNVNDIDPRFSYPYAFAAIALPPLKFPAEAIEIAKRGIKESDPDWRIPYYLATTYHIFFEDRKNAAHYFDVAANTPGAPENVKIINARYGTATNIREQTKQIWITIYETSDDEITRERAKNYIIHLEIIEALEKAVGIYKQKFGYYPKVIKDLVDHRILKSIPESPLGVRFRIGPDGGITFVQ